MPQTRIAPTAWIHTKVCPCCGYRGPEVQTVEEVGTFECPVCASDLYARPPMSYAEMEGLGQAHAPSHASARVHASDPHRHHGQRPRGWLGRFWALIRRVLPARA